MNLVDMLICAGDLRRNLEKARTIQSDVEEYGETDELDPASTAKILSGYARFGINAEIVGDYLRGAEERCNILYSGLSQLLEKHGTEDKLDLPIPGRAELDCRNNAEQTVGETVAK